jgi:tetratricopeptide (TPR) repeat protein
MTELPLLKIFLSSPGDVAEERALAEIVFRRLADEMADSMRFKLVIWEHEPLFAHASFQSQIERPSQCDLVVSILWSRLGTRLPADFAPLPGEPAPTGTEFELRDALAAHAQGGKPKVLIYRKIPAPQISLSAADFAERTDQYRRLDDFCRRFLYDADGAVSVAHSSFTDRHDFERRLAEHVRAFLDREVLTASPHAFRPLWRGKSPFRGLQSFEAEHQAIFFGRSQALGELMKRIRETEFAAQSGPLPRMLLVQGMSGTGKTSLFKAGLLPLLDLRPVEGIAQWIVTTLRPTESDPNLRAFGPLSVLATRLCEKVPAITRLGTTAEKLAEMLYARPQEAAAKIETCVAADAERAGLEPHRVRLLIYVDQLEETFALSDASNLANALFGALVALANCASLWVTATVRSDFVHRLEAYSNLMECLARNPPRTLLPPRADELAEMIREPANAAGLIWEPRDGVTLDQELLRDAIGFPEALPLLEYTLANLYERREGRLLRWSEYGGGLKGALISAADEVVAASEGDAEAAFRDVMRELVGVGEDGVATRRYASLSRFPSGSAARALLDRLVARRLCVTTDEGRGDGPVVCLSHEALIRSWPRADAWLQRETSLLRIRDELARDSSQWQRHQQLDAWLGVAPEKLAAIREVEQAGLMPPAALEYAMRSRRRAARNAWFKSAIVMLICLTTVVATGSWLYTLRQRDIARTEAATSNRITQFMVGLFAKADPSQSHGDSVTVKEVLDKGAQEIRSDTGSDSLQREPRVRAELLTAMGQAYTGLGIYQPAEALLKVARADQAVTTVPDDSRVRTLIASGNAAYLAAQYDEAAKLQSEAVDIARRHLTAADPLRSRALTSLAETLIQLGRFSEAEKLCREALSADRERGPEGSAVLAETLDELGKVYFYSGNLAAAESPMRESLALRTRAFGLRHTDTVQAEDNLGMLLYRSGRYTEALALFEAALPNFRAVYGEEHPEMATILNNIGLVRMITGHIDEAEPMLRQALAITEKFEGDSHDDLVGPLNSLALIDLFHHRLETAETEIKRADSIARLPDHGNFLDLVLLSEADIELAAGNTAHAAALLAESKSLMVAAHPKSPTEAWRYANWDAVDAERIARQGNVSAGASQLAAALPVLDKRFGTGGLYPMLARRRAQSIAAMSKNDVSPRAARSVAGNSP